MLARCVTVFTMDLVPCITMVWFSMKDGFPKGRSLALEFFFQKAFLDGGILELEPFLFAFVQGAAPLRLASSGMINTYLRIFAIASDSMTNDCAGFKRKARMCLLSKLECQ